MRGQGALVSLVLTLSLFSTTCLADDGFRMANGQLLTVGMSLAEVKAIAGKPESRNSHSTSTDGFGGNFSTTGKTLTYELTGSIGGKYRVLLHFHDGKVNAIRAKQDGRM